MFYGHLPSTFKIDSHSLCKSLCPYQAPLILRREQLNSEFRKADGDESDEEDEPQVQKKPAAKSAATKAAAKKAAAKKAAAKKAAAKKQQAAEKAAAKKKAEKEAAAKEKAEAKQAAAAKKAEAKVLKKPAGHGSTAGDEGSKPKRAKKGSCGTFARRYVPEVPLQAVRFNAIKSVFMEHLSSKLTSQSSFQDQG